MRIKYRIYSALSVSAYPGDEWMDLIVENEAADIFNSLNNLSDAFTRSAKEFRAEAARQGMKPEEADRSITQSKQKIIQGLRAALEQMEN
jgi:glutathionyl-hydroquinone reductase